MNREVAIIQRRLPHYRLPLFNGLRERLAQDGIRLRLLHGDPMPAERAKNDSGHLPWAEPLTTRYFAGGKLMWQPFARQTAHADLVIVTQENKHLHNLPLLLNPWRRQRLAFWGHGRNMQALRPDGLGERFKRWTSCRVDWWFAYTEVSAASVRESGFPAQAITVLNNSIDTAALAATLQAARHIPRAELRASLGLGAGPVGVFMGSLYTEKRIDFLLAAAVELQRRLPGFQLVIAGDGPDRERVQRAVAAHPGIHWLGSVHGERKAHVLAAADVMLNPGLVGLSILDAFVAGLPLFTTDCRLHSPEIAYLRQGHNGVMTSDTVDAYVAAVTSALSEPTRLQALQQAALQSADDYSIENMVQRYSDGIIQALM
jgi:L-malate glycosyltransferase